MTERFPLPSALITVWVSAHSRRLEQPLPAFSTLKRPGSGPTNRAQTLVLAIMVKRRAPYLKTYWVYGNVGKLVVDTASPPKSPCLGVLKGASTPASRSKKAMWAYTRQGGTSFITICRSRMRLRPFRIRWVTCSRHSNPTADSMFFGQSKNLRIRDYDEGDFRSLISLGGAEMQSDEEIDCGDGDGDGGDSDDPQDTPRNPNGPKLFKSSKGIGQPSLRLKAAKTSNQLPRKPTFVPTQRTVPSRSICNAIVRTRRRRPRKKDIPPLPNSYPSKPTGIEYYNGGANRGKGTLKAKWERRRSICLDYE
ncbi:hypothetical protein CPB86DRAFT_802088 [Serendipita vermifera]|nr:hypothetical protein CPB86DRAFT_802088 [Serendipita vermifera]